MDEARIFLARVGSHLYGTSTPESDDDFLGVFVPTTEQLLGSQNPPRELTENEKYSEGPRNEKGDVDRRYLSLVEYLKQASEGQSQALELLYTPEANIVHTTPLWGYVRRFCLDSVISQLGIRPILGFAKAQAVKSTKKGTNLTQICQILEEVTQGLELGLISPRQKLGDVFTNHPNGLATYGESRCFQARSESGAPVYEVAGRKFDVNSQIKPFVASLTGLKDKYGTRSKNAASEGVDRKSLMHAYRLIEQAKEFLSTGRITFPRPEADELKRIKSGEREVTFDYLDSQIEKVKKIETSSVLRSRPDHKAINRFVIKVHTQVVRGIDVRDLQHIPGF